MIIKVIFNQTLMDIAIQYYGDARALVDLANNNGLNIDSDVFAGESLIIEETANSIPVFAEYITGNDIKVVSGQGGDNEPVFVLATNDNEVFTDNNDNPIQI